MKWQAALAQLASQVCPPELVSPARNAFTNDHPQLLSDRRKIDPTNEYSVTGSKLFPATSLLFAKHQTVLSGGLGVYKCIYPTVQKSVYRKKDVGVLCIFQDHSFETLLFFVLEFLFPFQILFDLQ